MFEFFKRSYPQLDIDELITFTKITLKKINDLESENKALHHKLDLFIEALEQQNKIIKRLERDKKKQLIKYERINQN